MKKLTKKTTTPETTTTDDKPARRVVVLRELDGEELSTVAGGATGTAPQRPWYWS